MIKYDLATKHNEINVKKTTFDIEQKPEMKPTGNKIEKLDSDGEVITKVIGQDEDGLDIIEAVMVDEMEEVMVDIEVNHKIHRTILLPNADLTNEAQEIKDFAKKCFTAKVKKEYKARKDAEKVEADNAQAIEDAKPKPFTGEIKIGLKTFLFENGRMMVR